MPTKMEAFLCLVQSSVLAQKLSLSEYIFEKFELLKSLQMPTVFVAKRPLSKQVSVNYSFAVGQVLLIQV